MTDRMINNRIAKIRELEAQISAMNEEVESIKNELKDELDARQEDSLITKLHKVFYSCYERKTVDTDKLTAAGLYDEYSKKSAVVQFKITDIKQA